MLFCVREIFNYLLERLDQIRRLVVENDFCGEVGDCGRNIAAGSGNYEDWFADCITVAGVDTEANAFFAEFNDIAVAFLHGREGVIAHQGLAFWNFGLAPLFDVARHNGDCDSGGVESFFDRLDFGFVGVSFVKF